MKAYPTLRTHALVEMHSAIVNTATRVMEMQGLHPYKTCLNCDNFDEAKEICKPYNTRPPARIIAFGCENYSDDDIIPF